MDPTLWCDVEHARKELQRESDFKQKAFKQGMIRPFLLLASMIPTDRASLASSLGLDLSAQPCSGDAHAESWYLINKDVIGIQARANRAFTESLNPWASNCNWYEVVERVANRAFAEDKRNVEKALRQEIKSAGGLSFNQTIRACCDAADPLPRRMEELFMLAFHQVLISHLHEQQMRELVELTRSDEAHRLKERLSAAGWTDSALIDWTVGLALLELREKEREVALHLTDKKGETSTFDVCATGFNIATLPISSILVLPLFFIGFHSLRAVWGSSPGALISVIAGVLGQKARLNLAGVRIEDYY